jgi:hypothetical protein
MHRAVLVGATGHPSLGGRCPSGADSDVTGKQHQTQSDGCKAVEHSHSCRISE